MLRILLTFATAATGRQADVFDVTHYGAVGDGVTYDTDAVRAAASALAKHGGGELLFPASSGRNSTYLTAPFNLSSHIVLTVEGNATIMCSARGEDYPLIQVLPWIPFSSPAMEGYW